MHISRKLNSSHFPAVKMIACTGLTFLGLVLVGLSGTQAVYASGTSNSPTYDGSRSQIVSVTQCNGSDECVEPVSFSWNDENTSWPQSQSFSDFGKNNYSNDYSYPLISGDWNGDGFSDLGRVTSTGMSFYLGSASGMSGNFHLNDFNVGSYANSNDNPLITGDWNGDGLVDVGRVGSGEIKFYVSRGTGWNAHPTLNDFGKNNFANGRDYPVVTGDWNGDGRTDVARVIATGIKFYVADDNGWTAFGELADFGKNSFANGNDYPLVTGDWNGDGLTDVGRVNASGMKFYTSTGVAADSANNIVGWESYADLSDLGQGSYNNAENYPLITGDWNGDGLSDLGRVTSSGMSFHLSTGEGWQSKSALSDFGNSAYGKADSNPLVTGDWNRDGFTDMARVTATGMKFYIAHDHGWSEFATITDFGKSSYGSASTYPLITGDWNGDGLLDLARVTQSGMSLRSSLNSRYALLKSVTNSRGHLSTIGYKTLTDSTLYKKGATATYPEQDYTSAMTVVSSIERDDGIGGTRHIDYLYEGLRGDVTRGSFLGFSKVTSTDRERGTQTITDYRQDWPFSRRISKATRKQSNGVLISVKENTWEQVTTIPDVVRVRLAQSLSKSYEINAQTPTTDPDTGEPTTPLPIYDITLSAHVVNYDVASNLTDWDGTEKVHVNVTVDAGVVIGSNSSDSYALDFANLPQGSTASLTNNGDIIGYYGVVNNGDGGHAIKTSIPLKVTNNGQIYAGGGAGHNGSSRTATGTTSNPRGKDHDCYPSRPASVSCTASGGAGGRGAGWYGLGLFYSSAVNGSGGGSCSVGGGTGGCPGQRASTSGTPGTNGAALGVSSPTGGDAGIAFNGYSLVTFEVAGLWGGQVSEEATPTYPDGGGNGNTDPTDTADYTVSIAAHTENVNVATLLAAETDWDGATVSSVKVIVEPNIVVGSTSASNYAIDFSTLPTGFTAILDNKGSIVGSYGAVNNGVGGHAVKTNILLDVYNAGVIYAGGGGGHNGSSSTAVGYDAYLRDGHEDTCQTRRRTCTAGGGAGGRGAGWHSSGQVYLQAVSGTNGGSCSAGGGTHAYCGGEVRAYATGSSGTDGGAFGVNGQSGGAAGIAFDGYNLVTFKNEGVWAGRTVDGPITTAASSCKTILDAGNSTGNGYYQIDLDGAGGNPAVDVYCNMTDHGGGWTLAGSISTSNQNHFQAASHDSNGNGRIDFEQLGEKLEDDVISSLYTDRLWVNIVGGSGDIHCEKANQSGAGLNFTYNYSPTCGYTYNSTQYYAGEGADSYWGINVWKNYDYRAYRNNYSGCNGGAATYVPSGNGGCNYHPSRGGYLWVR